MGAHQLLAGLPPHDLPPSSPQTFTWVSNGDTNGSLYFIGRDDGVSAWTNPHTANFVEFIRSSFAGGDEGNEALCDRAVSYITTGLATPTWFALDFGAARTMVVSDYSLQNGAQDGANAPKNWKLQGSNDVASNDQTGIDAATWDDLDTRANNTAIATTVGAWAHFVLGSTPAAYRWVRILATGVNQAGLGYLQIGEMEFYGELTF